MSIYIQQPDKLQKLTGEKLTRSKIIAALGYTPSAFSGDYNDLTNKPITEDESDSSSLYVQDSSGNIIALIDEKGLTTTDLNAGGTLFSSFVEATEQAINNLDSIKANKSDVSESITAVEDRIDNITYDDIKGNPNLSDDGDYLEITDSNGNVLAHFDSNGFTAASVITQQLSINGTDVTDAITGIEATLNDYDGRITTNKDDIAENKTNIEANKSAIEALEEIVSPSGLQFNSSEFSIQDTSGNTILKVDESGLTTTNITSATTDNLQNQITTLANDIADVDQKADDINTDLSNHTSDTVKHITAAERSAWNAKATTNYVDTKVAGIVDTAPETLNTLNELAAALGDDPNFATTVANEIGTKASQTDLDAVEAEVDALQELIDENGLTFNNNEFVIQDASGNTLAKFDSDGLTVASIVSPTIDKINTAISDVDDKTTENYNQIETIKSQLNNKADASALTSHVNNTTIHVTSADKTNWSDKYTKSEIDTKVKSINDAATALSGRVDSVENTVKTKANASDLEALGGRVETAEGEIDALQELIDEEGLTFNNSEFIIEDSSGNTLAKFDASGLTVASIVSPTIDAINSTLNSYDNRIEGVETNSHTHTNKLVLDATTASYTTAEKTKLSGIAANAQVNVIETIATDNVNVTITSSDKTRTITGVAAQSDLTALGNTVNGKASQSDLEALGGRVESAEEEIDALQGVIDENGLKFTKDEFVIEDSKGNTLAKFDASGLTVSAIVSPTITDVDNKAQGAADKADDLENELTNYVKKETGKGLSQNDLTNDLKQSYDTAVSKLSGISDNANKVEASTTNGNIKIDGVEKTVYTLPSDVVVDADLNDLNSKKHEHINKDVLDKIDTEFTSTLKTSYDEAVSKLNGIQDGATKVEASTNGKIKINGTDTTVYTLPSDVVVDADLNDYQPKTLSVPLYDNTTVEGAISAIHTIANQASSGLGGVINGSISVAKAIADQNGDEIDTTYAKQSQLNDYALASSLNDYAQYSDDIYTNNTNAPIAVAVANGVGPSNVKLSDLAKVNDLNGLLSDADVIDNLTTDNMLRPLSARQGKILDEKIKNISDIAAGAGNGDMLKSIFATQDAANGKVDHAIYSDTANIADNANKLNGQEASYYATANSVNNIQTMNDYVHTPLKASTSSVRYILSTGDSASTALVQAYKEDGDGGDAFYYVNYDTAAYEDEPMPEGRELVVQEDLDRYAKTSDLSNYVQSSTLSSYATQEYVAEVLKNATGGTDASSVLASLNAHTSNQTNPHSVTAAQVGAYTTHEVDNALARKASISSLSSYAKVADLDDYVKSTNFQDAIDGINNELSGKATSSDLQNYVLNSTLNDYKTLVGNTYATQQSVENAVGYFDETIADYYTATEVDNKIADGQVDLSGYMAKSEYATKETGKVDHAVYADATNLADNANKLGGINAGDYITTTTLNGKGYLTSSSLNNYYTSAQVDNKLNDYVTTTVLNSKGYLTSASLNGYITTLDLNSALTSYVKLSDLNGYITTTSFTTYQNTVSSTYATQTSLGNYYTKTEVNTKFNDYATNDHVDQHVASEIEDALLNYYTKTQVDGLISSSGGGNFDPTILNDYLALSGGNMTGSLFFNQVAYIGHNVADDVFRIDTQARGGMVIESNESKISIISDEEINLESGAEINVTSYDQITITSGAGMELQSVGDCDLSISNHNCTINLSADGGIQLDENVSSVSYKDESGNNVAMQLDGSGLIVSSITTNQIYSPELEVMKDEINRLSIKQEQSSGGGMQLTLVGEGTLYDVGSWQFEDLDFITDTLNGHRVLIDWYLGNAGHIATCIVPFVANKETHIAFNYYEVSSMSNGMLGGVMVTSPGAGFDGLFQIMEFSLMGTVAVDSATSLAERINDYGLTAKFYFMD